MTGGETHPQRQGKSEQGRESCGGETTIKTPGDTKDEAESENKKNKVHQKNRRRVQRTPHATRKRKDRGSRNEKGGKMSDLGWLNERYVQLLNTVSRDVGTVSGPRRCRHRKEIGEKIGFGLGECVAQAYTERFLTNTDDKQDQVSKGNGDL